MSARFRFRRLFALAAFALAGSAGAQPASPLPLFDAHLHYNDDAREPYPAVDVLTLFRTHGVTAILATSRPNDGTRALLAAAATTPGATPRVVPFIRPYRNQGDRSTWFDDAEIYALIEAELARGIDYRGIGEFHVFGRDAATPWVGKIVALAVARGLWLYAHCDEEALQALFAHDPRAKVIWAHAGFLTPPQRIAEWLVRHPTLVGELSYRYDITVDGKLAPAWRSLLTTHPDRFIVGSDTWVNDRWARYGEIIAWNRAWLAQLPPEVARAIAHGNGERLFPARR